MERSRVSLQASTAPCALRPFPSPIEALAETGVLAERDFELRFFPIHDFQRQGVAALFCTPVFAPAGAEALYGHRAFPEIGAQEWSEIDGAMLAHTLSFARRLDAAGIVVGVGASVSFKTLCDPNGRVLYREALRALHAREQSTLVLKIEDIPATTGSQRIAEIVSCVRSLVPRVWVHLPGSPVPLSGHEQLHATGLVLSMPPRLPLHGMQTEARWLTRTAALQTALACMDHVDTAMELETVRAAGIRFVAGHALQDPALMGDAAPEDIRAAVYGTVRN